MKDFKKYITDKKEISAGFLFETPEGFLLVHPTARAKGKGNWDIPKGHIETGEYPLEAAIRELKEETGLDYNPDWETDFLGQPYIISHPLPGSAGCQEVQMYFIFRTQWPGDSRK